MRLRKAELDVRNAGIRRAVAARRLTHAEIAREFHVSTRLVDRVAATSRASAEQDPGLETRPC